MMRGERLQTVVDGSRFTLYRKGDAVFVEVGVKAVLTNLMTRKWIKRPRYTCDSLDDTAAHLADVIATLRAPANETRSATRRASI